MSSVSLADVTLVLKCDLLHHKAATKYVITKGEPYHRVFEIVNLLNTSKNASKSYYTYYPLEDLKNVFFGHPDESLLSKAETPGSVGAAAKVELMRRDGDEAMVGSWTDDHVIARLRSFARTGLEKAALEELIKRYDTCVKAYVEVACE